MSSLRRTLSSRSNGALSRGPVTPEGKQRSAMNALSHGLLARTTLMRGEWADGLEGLLDQYVDRLAPVDAVEYGYVEEMVAASWRLRRLWAIETRTLYNEAAAQTAGDRLDRIAAAFAQLAEKPHPDLLHRYELRMHLTYQRALHNLLLLRTAGTNEPSPISGHSGDPKPTEDPASLPSRARQQAVVSPVSSPPAASPHLPVAPTPGRNVGPTLPSVEQAVLPATPAVLPADGDCRSLAGPLHPPANPPGQCLPAESSCLPLAPSPGRYTRLSAPFDVQLSPARGSPPASE